MPLFHRKDNNTHAPAMEDGVASWRALNRGEDSAPVRCRGAGESKAGLVVAAYRSPSKGASGRHTPQHLSHDMGRPATASSSAFVAARHQQQGMSLNRPASSGSLHEPGFLARHSSLQQTYHADLSATSPLCRSPAGKEPGSGSSLLHRPPTSPAGAAHTRDSPRTPTSSSSSHMHAHGLSGRASLAARSYGGADGGQPMGLPPPSPTRPAGFKFLPRSSSARHEQHASLLSSLVVQQVGVAAPGSPPHTHARAMLTFSPQAHHSHGQHSGVKARRASTAAQRVLSGSPSKSVHHGGGHRGTTAPQQPDVKASDQATLQRRFSTGSVAAGQQWHMSAPAAGPDMHSVATGAVGLHPHASRQLAEGWGTLTCVRPSTANTSNFALAFAAESQQELEKEYAGGQPQAHAAAAAHAAHMQQGQQRRSSTEELVSPAPAARPQAWLAASQPHPHSQLSPGKPPYGAGGSPRPPSRGAPTAGQHAAASTQQQQHQHQHAAAAPVGTPFAEVAAHADSTAARRSAGHDAAASPHSYQRQGHQPQAWATTVADAASASIYTLDRASYSGTSAASHAAASAAEHAMRAKPATGSSHLSHSNATQPAVQPSPQTPRASAWQPEQQQQQQQHVAAGGATGARAAAAFAVTAWQESQAGVPHAWQGHPGPGPAASAATTTRPAAVGAVGYGTLDTQPAHPQQPGAGVVRAWAATPSSPTPQPPTPFMQAYAAHATASPAQQPQQVQQAGAAAPRSSSSSQRGYVTQLSSHSSASHKSTESVHAPGPPAQPAGTTLAHRLSHNSVNTAAAAPGAPSPGTQVKQGSAQDGGHQQHAVGHQQQQHAAAAGRTATPTAHATATTAAHGTAGGVHGTAAASDSAAAHGHEAHTAAVPAPGAAPATAAAAAAADAASAASTNPLHMFVALASQRVPVYPPRLPHATDDAALLSGHVSSDHTAALPGYTVGKVIGEGGFCQVRLAVHRLSGRRVAVKVIDKLKLADASEARRIQREIRVMRHLSHECVIKLFEVVDAPSLLYLVMEHAPCGSLLDYVRGRKRLAEPDAIRVVQQLVAGLAYCHAREVVHRDVKLENILLDANNTMKLIDFGLSAFFIPGKQLRVHCGSPSYAAPEIVSRKHYDGPPVDVWSLGVVLFAMLAGHLPFHSSQGNKQELCNKIMEGRYTCPEHVSPHAKDLLARMLCVEPGRRITLVQVAAHPWVSGAGAGPGPSPSPRWEALGASVYMVRVDPAGGLVYADEQLVEELEGAGYTRDTVLQHLLAGDANYLTAGYFLLAEGKVEVIRRMRGSTAAQRYIQRAVPPTTSPGAPSALSGAGGGGAGSMAGGMPDAVPAMHLSHAYHQHCGVAAAVGGSSGSGRLEAPGLHGPGPAHDAAASMQATSSAASHRTYIPVG